MFCLFVESGAFSHCCQELAQSKTPITRSDMLVASQTELQRLQEPTYFQFPEVSPPQSQSSPPGPLQQPQLKDQDQVWHFAVAMDNFLNSKECANKPEICVELIIHVPHFLCPKTFNLKVNISLLDKKYTRNLPTHLLSTVVNVT